MYSICRKFKFEAGHRLMNSDEGGKCYNLHGHSYIVEVYLNLEEIREAQEVTDFDGLSVLKDHIEEKFDGGMILNELDNATIEFCKFQGFKILTMSADPTVENMACWFFHKVKSIDFKQGISVSKVVVWESENCSAEYKPN